LGKRNILIFFIADVYYVAVRSSRSLGTWVLECSSAPFGIFSIFTKLHRLRYSSCILFGLIYLTRLSFYDLLDSFFFLNLSTGISVANIDVESIDKVK
jgi:hypothetical protein